MNFCPNCGKALKPDQNFCDSCGAAVSPTPFINQAGKPIISTTKPSIHNNKHLIGIFTTTLNKTFLQSTGFFTLLILCSAIPIFVMLTITSDFVNNYLLFNFIFNWVPLLFIGFLFVQRNNLNDSWTICFYYLLLACDISTRVFGQQSETNGITGFNDWSFLVMVIFLTNLIAISTCIFTIKKWDESHSAIKKIISGIISFHLVIKFLMWMGKKPSEFDMSRLPSVFIYDISSVIIHMEYWILILAIISILIKKEIEHPLIS